MDTSSKHMTLTREFDAPLERVWEAWTTPAYFAQWFGYPLTTPIEKVSLDVKPGGQWRATMLNTDGSELPFAGTYREVVKPEKLVMVFTNIQDPGDPNVEVLTVTFRAREEKTKLTLHQAGHLPDEQYPKLVEGYTNFMNGLEKLLTSLKEK